MRQVKEICEEVRAQLTKDGIPFGENVPLGVMVETPSAAVTADLLAAESDFFAIGTNDLIQYALAVDRQDEHVGYLYHPLHPALLRLIKGVIEAGNRSGTPVSMCGDMAGDPLTAWVLMGLGLRTFSMSPGRFQP